MRDTRNWADQSLSNLPEYEMALHTQSRFVLLSCECDASRVKQLGDLLSESLAKVGFSSDSRYSS
jgi:hypothetical protein